MAYSRTYWLDHVTSPSNCFKITDNGDGTVTITRAGTVMQQGTSQDASHFNKPEEELSGVEAAVELLMNFARQNAWEIERGQVTLTNTSKYPFNSSKATVPLSKVRENGDYVVICEVSAFSGNVGEIVVSDRLTNGFKLAFAGSAASATIKYQVIGGYMK